MLLKKSSINQTVRLLENVCEDTVKMSVGNAVEMFFHVLGGLSLADCQTLTKLLYGFPSSTGHGEKIRWKSSWVEIKSGSTRILIYCQLNKTELETSSPSLLTTPSLVLSFSNSASSLIRHGLSTGCREISAPHPGAPPPSPSFPLTWVSLG